MKKLLFIIGLLLIVLTSFVSATTPTISEITLNGYTSSPYITSDTTPLINVGTDIDSTCSWSLDNSDFTECSETDSISNNCTTSILDSGNNNVWIKCINGVDATTEKMRVAVNDTGTFDYTSWYDTDYDYRLPINCSELDTGAPFVINGSNGFEIDGYKQIVWTTCDRPDMWVYYNNQTDYIVSDGLYQIAHEVEDGDSASYNPTDVWGTKYSMVQHDNGNLIDSTSFGHDMTNSGAVTSELGLTDGGYFTDTGDTYYYPDDPFHELQAFTWSIDVNASSLGGASQNTLMENRVIAATRYGCAIIQGAASTSATCYLGSGTSGFTTSVATEIPLDEFTQVDLTYDGSELDIFYNGVEQSYSAQGSGTVAYGSNVFSIGSSQGTYGYVQGVTDEVRIVSEVMTADQVNDTYQNYQATPNFGTLGAEESQASDTFSILQYLYTSPSPDQNLTLINATGDGFDITPSFVGSTSASVTGCNLSSSVGEYVCTTSDNLVWSCLHSGDLNHDTTYNITLSCTDDSTTDTITREVSTFGLPVLTDLSYVSTGGTETNYLQQLTHINVTVVDSDSSLKFVELLVNNPSGTKLYTNMTQRGSGSIWDYNTSIVLDATGLWNIITIAENEFNFTANTSVSFTVVKTSNATVSDNYFGYDLEHVNTTAEIDTIAGYDYNLFGHRIEFSNITTEWSNLKRNLNHTFDGYSGRNFITVYFDDSDYLNATATIDCVTIANNFSDLKQYPYLDSMAFMVLESNNLANRVSFLNRVAECILSETGNNFPIYSKSFNDSGLDTDYVSFWTMPYIWTSNLNEWVNAENSYLRNTTTLTRIYANSNPTLWTKQQTYHNDVLSYIRSTPNITTTISETKAIELLNQDLIVFNNESSAKNISVTHTGAFTSDVWDYTHKVLYKSISSSIDILVGIYDATLLYVDTFNQIFLTTTTQGTLFKSSTTGKLYDTFSDGGTGDGSFTIVSANDVRGELWSPDFVYDNTFMITYEQLNYSYVTDFSPYDLIIINKGTTSNSPAEVNASLEPLVNAGILDKAYGYISVADYNNTNSTGDNITDCSITNSWESMKQAEADVWIDNYYMNVFVDGFDIGYATTPDCFEDRIKRLGDHITINKGKQVIFNTYTIYETVSNYGDYVMRESCFSRWDGTVGSPTYSYESLSLMVSHSTYFKTSTKPVLCMAFGDVNDYDKIAYDFMGFAVMYGADGNNLFKYAQPNFQTQREMKVPDIGTMLGSDYNNDSATDWYRTYENGIAHFNPYRNSTFDNGKYYWFDDGKTVNSINVGGIFQNYASGCDAGKNQNLYINEDNMQTIKDSDISGTCVAWATANLSYSLPISAYEPHGHYYLRIEPETRGNGVGINIFNRLNTETGVHSWWDNTAFNPPTETQWTAYGRAGDTGKETINWKMYIDVNTTVKASVDANINTITQTNSQNGWSVNNRDINLSSNSIYNISVISRPVYVNSSSLVNVTFGSTLLSVKNTTTCNTTEPTFNTTTILGSSYGVCRTNELTGYTYRFDVPILSTMDTFTILTIADTTAPTVSVTVTNQIVEAVTGNTTFNITISDLQSGIDSWNYNYTYPNGTIILSAIGVIDADNSIEFNVNNLINLGTYNISVWAIDNDGNINTTGTYFNVTDTTNPSLTWSSPSISASYSTLSNLTMNVTCSDLVALNNVTMFVNGVVNQTNTTPVNNSVWSFSFVPSSYTAYNINFSCYDSSANVNTSDTRIFTYTVPVVATPTTSAGSSSSSSSPVLQTGGTCLAGQTSFEGHCIIGTYISSIVVDDIDTTVCDNRKTYWSFKTLNNEGQYELSDDMFITFKYNNSDNVIVPLRLNRDSFIYNDYVDFKGEPSIGIELVAYDELIGIEYQVNYETTISGEICSGLDLTVFNDILDKRVNITPIKESWQKKVYNEDETVNKKSILAMILLGVALLLFIYYGVFKE